MLFSFWSYKLAGVFVSVLATFGCSLTKGNSKGYPERINLDHGRGEGSIRFPGPSSVGLLRKRSVFCCARIVC